MTLLHLPDLISLATGRTHSLFESDMQRHSDALRAGIEGRSLLVVGGAGTIGSAFISAACQYRPRKLVVLDHDENGLTELVRTLRSTQGQYVPSELLMYPVGFSTPVAQEIIELHGPFQIVANFAAHKHVRSEKDIFSIHALLSNNVFEARRFLERTRETKPERYFCVSTDKAVSPANVMGASKQLMERLILAQTPQMHATTARFANVAFSQGSLLDGFVRRLLKGQPLSAPSDVRRYFVSPLESGQICLMACVLGLSGDIFFPKFEDEAAAQRFSDIATRVLGHLGLEPVLCSSEDEARQRAARRCRADRGYPVYFFESDTSGEKNIESFYADGQVVDLARFEALGVIPRQNTTPSSFLAFLDDLERLTATYGATKEQLIGLISRELPDFEHHETGRNLDQRM